MVPSLAMMRKAMLHKDHTTEQNTQMTEICFVNHLESTFDGFQLMLHKTQCCVEFYLFWLILCSKVPD